MNWRMMFAVATLVALYSFLGATNWHPVVALENRCPAGTSHSPYETESVK